MAKIKIDDVEYDTDDMSDNAKAQVASLQFNEAHMNRLRNELAIADTAKIAYVNALKRELENSEENNKIANQKQTQWPNRQIKSLFWYDFSRMGTNCRSPSQV